MAQWEWLVLILPHPGLQQEKSRKLEMIQCLRTEIFWSHLWSQVEQFCYWLSAWTLAILIARNRHIISPCNFTGWPLIGLFTAYRLGYRTQCPKRARQRLYYLIGSNIGLLTLSSLESQASPFYRNNVKSDFLTGGRSKSNCKRSCLLRNAASISGKHNQLCN